jgi:myosin heavy chain 6/7
MGEMKFKERGEQAEPEGTAEAEKVSFLLGVNSNDFIKCLVKPKIKVGTEVVTQGRNKAQVYSINISLIFYARPLPSDTSSGFGLYSKNFV